MTEVSVWRNPNFRRVWGAGAISTIGNEVGELALPILALVTLGATATELSWIRAATFLPYLLLTMWLGVVVDRRRRRPLMIMAEGVSAVLLLGIAGTALVGWLQVPALIAATFVLGSLAVLHMLADFSFLPKVVTADQLPQANAHVTATQSTIGVAGNGVGGALVQVLTAPVAVALNGLSRLGAALLLVRVRTLEQPPPPQTDGIARQAKEGMTSMLRHRTVRALAGEATCWNLGNEMFILALTVLIVTKRSDGALALGLVLMAGGVGAVLGASVSDRLTRRYGYGHSLIAAMLLGNTAPLVGVLAAADIPSTPSLVVLAVAFLASGIGVGVANSQAVTVRQLTVPEDLRGRVNAAYRLLSWGALSIGAMTAGLAVSLLGLRMTALLGATLMAIATLPVIFSPVRHMRDLDDDPTKSLT